jgi:hypothetical protein
MKRQVKTQKLVLSSVLRPAPIVYSGGKRIKFLLYVVVNFKNLNYQNIFKQVSGSHFRPVASPNMFILYTFFVSNCLCKTIHTFNLLSQVAVYMQIVVVPRLCLSGEGVWHHGEYLQLLVPAIRFVLLVL